MTVRLGDGRSPEWAGAGWVRFQSASRARMAAPAIAASAGISDARGAGLRARGADVQRAIAPYSRSRRAASSANSVGAQPRSALNPATRRWLANASCSNERAFTISAWVPVRERTRIAALLCSGRWMRRSSNRRARRRRCRMQDQVRARVLRRAGLISLLSSRRRISNCLDRRVDFE